MIRPIHIAEGLVDVTWRDDLAAVQLKRHSGHDEGDRARRAVFAALGHVNAHGVKNWLAAAGEGKQAKILDNEADIRAFFGAA